MIVISGALVLMAAILLFIGLLAGSSLTAIYVSIGLSIVAAVFLWLGINQRPVEAPAGVPGEGDRRDRGARGRADDGETDRSSQRGQHSRAAGAKQAAKEAPREPERPAEVTQQIDVMSDDLVEDSDERTVAAAVATGADVFVVSGHPRYHLEECPAVTGNDEAETLPIGEARELGFVPCGVCRPDSEIAENAALPHTSNGSSAPAAAPVAAAAAAGEPEMVNAPPAVAAQAQPAAPIPPPAVAPPPGTDVPPTVPTAPLQPAAYQQQPEPPQPAQWQQPAQPQPAQWQQPAPPVADQPPAAYQAPPQQPPVSYGAPVSQPPATQLPVAGQPPVAQQPAAAEAPELVVVLPGKARFHRPDCRLVSGPDATETLDKADAVRQGYLACAICKP